MTIYKRVLEIKIVREKANLNLLAAGQVEKVEIQVEKIGRIDKKDSHAV